MSNNPEASLGQGVSPGLLHETYQDLQNSGEVDWAVQQSSESIPNDPHQRVATYLGSLVGRHGLMGGSEERRQAQVAHHVMDPEDIPESYFDRQREIARQQGHGDIEITDEMRRQHSEAIIADQTASLNAWAEYLDHPDADYPAWFRYYTMRNVLKLADYDTQKGRFRKRSNKTTAPYPELNREALAYVYETLNRRLKGREQNDEQIQELAQQANFNKLYSHALAESVPSNPEQLQNTAGEWTTYQQLDPEEDADRSRQLAQSLQGYGTGWCTAGESTAEMQLRDGDFHVYYSYDREGEPTVPRVAVRMENGQVAEVRGIETGEHLEPTMTDITMERVKDLPGGQEYLQAAEDMNRVTDIENRVRQGQELTAQDIYFLREYGGQIQSFGYKKDPRIGELLQDRNLSADVDMMLEEFDHAQLARDMLESGYRGQNTLAENLEKFQPEAVDQAKLARDLMNSGQYGMATLANNLEKFQPEAVDHTKLARDMMRNGVGDILVRNLDKFQLEAADQAELARDMMDNDLEDMEILANNLEKFQPEAVDQTQLAHDLMARGRKGMVILANNLDKFQDGAVDHAELAHGLLEFGPRGQNHLVKNLDKFQPEAVDQNQIVWHLMNKGGEHIFVDNLDKFLQSEAVDHTQLVRDMMDSGVHGAKILAENLDKFQTEAVDQTELVRNLLKSGPSGQNTLTDNLDKFLQSEVINQAQLARDLMDSGMYGVTVLAQNLDKFQSEAVDHTQLVRDMMDSGVHGAKILADNLDKFQPEAVDHTQLVRKLMDNGLVLTLAQNLDKFFPSETLDQAELARNLRDSGVDGAKILADNLYKSPEGAVDPDQLTQDMLESGYSGQNPLAENLDKFL